MDSKSIVLLVDDEPLTLSSYVRVLRTLDLEVLTAEGPSEALELLSKKSVDVVIADYRMPNMMGDELLERMRDDYPDVIRILNSGYADIEVVEEVLRRGQIFRFLTKPCDPDKLKGAVTDALAERRSNQENLRQIEQQKFNLQSFRMIFYSALDPMMLADLEGNLVEVNTAFVTASGFHGRHDALLARPNIMSYWEQEKDWPEILETVHREGHWSDEVSHKSEQRYALLSVSQVNDDSGKPFALAALEKDITARRKLEQESRAAQYEVILSLAKLAEYRDPETFAHLERMRRYSQIVATRLGRNPRFASIIDDDYVQAVFASSPLHDVGKVGIPDAVLLKPGKLDKGEWEVMQLHTRIGSQILSVAGSSLTQKSWLSMGRTIALQHHEKMDGSGYPVGLKGEEIDLSARIVALADAYDAITSKRVYKKAFPHAEARERIVESSGSHFDPDVVEAFLDCEDEFTAVKQSYVDPEVVTDQAEDMLARVQRLLAPHA